MKRTNPTDPEKVYGPLLLPEVEIRATKKPSKDFASQVRDEYFNLMMNPLGFMGAAPNPQLAAANTLMSLPQYGMSYGLMSDKDNRTIHVADALGITNPYLAMAATLAIDPANFVGGPFRAPVALRRGTDLRKWSNVLLRPLSGGIHPDNYRQFTSKISKPAAKELARLAQRLNERAYLPGTFDVLRHDTPIIAELPGMQGGVYTMVGGTPMIGIGTKGKNIDKAKMVARGLGHMVEDSSPISNQLATHMRTSLDIDPLTKSLASTLYSLYDELPALPQSPSYKMSMDRTLTNLMDRLNEDLALRFDKMPYGIDAATSRDLRRLSLAKNQSEASQILRSSPNLQSLLDMSEFFTQQRAYPMFRESFPVLDEPIGMFPFRKKPFNPSTLKSDREFLKEIKRLNLDKRLPLFRYIEPTAKNLKELRGFLEDLP